MFCAKIFFFCSSCWCEKIVEREDKGKRRQWKERMGERGDSGKRG